MMAKIKPPALRSSAFQARPHVELARKRGARIQFIPEQAAFDKKLVDYIASDEQDLFRQLSGKTVKRFDGTTVFLNWAGHRSATTHDASSATGSWDHRQPHVFTSSFDWEHWLSISSSTSRGRDPRNDRYTFIVLAAFAMHLLPIRFAALAMILLAFALFAAEASLPATVR